MALGADRVRDLLGRGRLVAADVVDRVVRRRRARARSGAEGEIPHGDEEDDDRCRPEVRADAVSVAVMDYDRVAFVSHAGSPTACHGLDAAWRPVGRPGWSPSTDLGP